MVNVQIGGFLSTLSLRRATGKAVTTRGNHRHFYPRSPCGERLVYALILANAMLFLSTLSLRRATICFDSNELNSSYFYPRSPCGERQNKGAMMVSDVIFLSTLSLRRATRVNNPVKIKIVISIHALLAESDHANRYYVGLHLEFLSTLSLRRATLPSIATYQVA